MSKKLRCAIYTRKSTDEGLDQSFNSLDAQHEACSAFILSQTGEGWTPIKDRYDDGGFSGGTIERPGLQRLLADIDGGRVDVVVVYKVDRLTRALSDFARIVERLDKAGASFVSVTQAFNTTTSMGRLTLNVLLSFAQFEREVTGERIRDKIAASKARGMWMGGYPPLGYDVRDRGLHINEAEADRVRAIFQSYLELPNTIALRDHLERTGVRSKSWIARTGRMMGGYVFSRGGLSYLLRNRIYLGEVTHRGKSYPGEHRAIVSAELFAAVQEKLAAGAPERPSIDTRGRPGMLRGKLFDDRGNAMTTAHANKQSGKRYFYYVSTALNTGKPRGAVARLSAPKVEAMLCDFIAPLLRADWRPDEAAPLRIAHALSRGVVHADHVLLDLRTEALSASQLALHDAADETTLSIKAPLQLARTQRARTLVANTNSTPAPRTDRALIRAIISARRWAKQLATNEAPSLREIARREDVCPSYAREILPLAFLAPDLVEAILDGRQPSALSLRALVAQPLPPAWSDQRALFAKFA